MEERLIENQKIDRQEPQPVLVEADNLKVQLENIASDVQRLTDGMESKLNPWLRQREIELPSGVTVILAYTFGHPDGEYAAVVEEQPREGKNITRRWNHQDSATVEEQEVTERAKQIGSRHWEVTERRQGFTKKDIGRMTKLIQESLEVLEAANG